VSPRTVSVALALSLLVVPACGGDDGSGPTSSDRVQSTDAPDPRDAAALAADKALAESSLLVLADFPAGWSEVPSVDVEGPEQEIASCLGRTRRIGGGEASAETGDFTSPADDDVAEAVEIAASEDEAIAVVSALNGPDVPACLQGVYRDFVQDLIDNPPDQASELPEGTTLGDLTVARLNVTSVGDETSALRVSVPIVLKAGTTITQYIDMVVVRSGRALAVVAFNSTLSPFPTEDIDEYVGIAASRLPSEA